MTSTVHPTTSLLALPPEIRAIIYNHLSRDSQVRWNHKPAICGHFVPSCSRCSQRGRNCFPLPTTDVSQYPFTLTATCKLLRTEFLDALVANTHVQFCCTAALVIHTTGFPRPIPSILHGIRTVSIGCPILHKFPPGTFPSLRTLRVTQVDMPVKDFQSMDEIETIAGTKILDTVADSHVYGGLFCLSLRRYRALQPLRVFMQLCYKPVPTTENQTTMVVALLDVNHWKIVERERIGVRRCASGP